MVQPQQRPSTESGKLAPNHILSFPIWCGSYFTKTLYCLIIYWSNIRKDLKFHGCHIQIKIGNNIVTSCMCFESSCNFCAHIASLGHSTKDDKKLVSGTIIKCWLLKHILVKARASQFMHKMHLYLLKQLNNMFWGLMQKYHSYTGKEMSNISATIFS